jgi:hypothetical protein
MKHLTEWKKLYSFHKIMLIDAKLSGGRVGYLNRGDSPIAQMFNGICKRDRAFIVHLALSDGHDYEFDYSKIDGAVEARSVEMISTKTGDSMTVLLSASEVAYIQARKNGSGYDEIMTLSGFPNGYYGHRPYELD